MVKDTKKPEPRLGDKKSFNVDFGIRAEDAIEVTGEKNPTRKEVRAAIWEILGENDFEKPVRAEAMTDEEKEQLKKAVSDARKTAKEKIVKARK